MLTARLRCRLGSGVNRDEHCLLESKLLLSVQTFSATQRAVVTAVIKRILISTGIAITMSCAVAMPAAASPDLTPRAGEWWLSSWRILPVVWPLTQGGGVTVAILDSGVQASVPDLRGVTLRGG